MKLRIAVIAILCIGLACSVSMLSIQVHAQGNKAATVVMPKITVLNPMGTPPPIQKTAGPASGHAGRQDHLLCEYGLYRNRSPYGRNEGLVQSQLSQNQRRD